MIILFLFGCKKGSNEEIIKLPTDLFNYTDELKSTMKTLSEKSDFCNLDKEKVIIKSKRFIITNKYIIPFLYFELLRYAVPIADYTKEEIESFFYFTGKNRAMNYALYLEAKESGAKVTQDEINTKLLEISGNDIETFKNNMAKSSIKFEFVVEDITQVLMIEKFKESIVIKDVSVTDEELEEYFNKNPSIALVNPKATVRHILLKTEGLNETQKEDRYKKMEDILKLARGKKDFAALAKQYSEDTATKNSGGRLGEFVERGKLIKEFEDAVFNTKVGEISDIFETSNGYHIVKVENIKSQSKKKFNDVKDEIKEIILVNKKNKKIDETKKIIDEKYQITEELYQTVTE